MKKLWKWLFGTQKQQCNINDVSESVCDNCTPVSGFYLGMICPKCNRPFRSVKQTVANIEITANQSKLNRNDKRR